MLSFMTATTFLSAKKWTASSCATNTKTTQKTFLCHHMAAKMTGM